MIWRVHLGFNTDTIVGDALMSFVVHFVGCKHGKKGPIQNKHTVVFSWSWCTLEGALFHLVALIVPINERGLIVSMRNQRRWYSISLICEISATKRSRKHYSSWHYSLKILLIATLFTDNINTIHWQTCVCIKKYYHPTKTLGTH